MPWNFQMGVRDDGRAFSDGRSSMLAEHDPKLVRRMVRNYVNSLRPS